MGLGTVVCGPVSKDEDGLEGLCLRMCDIQCILRRNALYFLRITALYIAVFINPISE